MPARRGTATSTGKRSLYDPSSAEPFKLSRSKIDLILDCPRCFYLDRRLGISRPPGPPFTLNNAVDALLKKEFDGYRVRKQPHPLMTQYGIVALPFEHPNLDKWRHNFTGVQHLHTPTNFLTYGAVDDLWIDSSGNLLVVDYKATSTEKKITLDDEWKQGYKRQMEVYQWLLRRNGFPVSSTGYFVFANAGKNREAFDGRLDCTVQVIPYTGDDGWVERALLDARRTLDADAAPACSDGCEWCAYREAAVLPAA